MFHTKKSNLVLSFEGYLFFTLRWKVTEKWRKRESFHWIGYILFDKSSWEKNFIESQSLWNLLVYAKQHQEESSHLVQFFNLTTQKYFCQNSNVGNGLWVQGEEKNFFTITFIYFYFDHLFFFRTFNTFRRQSLLQIISRSTSFLAFFVSKYFTMSSSSLNDSTDTTKRYNDTISQFHIHDKKSIVYVNEKKMCDFTFHVGETEFQCNSLLLAQKSMVFKEFIETNCSGIDNHFHWYENSNHENVFFKTVFYLLLTAILDASKFSLVCYKNEKIPFQMWNEMFMIVANWKLCKEVGDRMLECFSNDVVLTGYWNIHYLQNDFVENQWKARCTQDKVNTNTLLHQNFRKEDVCHVLWENAISSLNIRSDEDTIRKFHNICMSQLLGMGEIIWLYTPGHITIHQYRLIHLKSIIGGESRENIRRLQQSECIKCKELIQELRLEKKICTKK